MAAQGMKSANELAEDRTGLAVKRTLMAADRTLMAWVRTALSMISFGFTIYKLIQGFQEVEGFTLANRVNPMLVGEFLVGLGILSMALGSVEYWLTLKEIIPISLSKICSRPSFVMALIISVVGLAVFFSIMAHLI